MSGHDIYVNAVVFGGLGCGALVGVVCAFGLWLTIVRLVRRGLGTDTPPQ